jgi:hypothetical protein
MRQYLSALRE